MHNHSIENNYYSVRPIGGVGAIGQNLTAITNKDQTILVDIGVQFAKNDFLGINHIIPDLGQIDFSGEVHLIITHAHEDHIGAFEHLLTLKPDLKIFAPLLAKNILSSKFEKSKKILPKINVYKEDDTLTIKSLIVTPIAVNHSIPDTYGLLFQDLKRECSLFFSSDFKYDHQNLYEKPMNLKRLVELTRLSKYRYLLADSTCANKPGKTNSEKDIILPIKKIIESNLNQNIFITFFASNLHRFITFLNMAKQTKRKILLVGRSLKFYFDQIEKYYPYHNFNELIVDDSIIHERKDLIILMSGPQGDLRGGLRRIVYDECPFIKIKANDIFIFSSRPIPGNENRIYSLYNLIAAKGAKVIDSKDGLFHCSGHASQVDLKILTSYYLPHYYIPIHGETYLLTKNIDYIKTEFPQIKTSLLKNNDILCLTKDGPQYIFNDPCDLKYVIGHKNIVDKTIINKKISLSQNGVCLVATSGVEEKDLKVNVMVLGLPDLTMDQERLIKRLITIQKKSSKQQRYVENIKSSIRKRIFKPMGLHPSVYIISF